MKSSDHVDKPGSRELAMLTLAALGVVYGDIGTSPLYAFRECFHGSHGLATSPENILGVLSLMFWSLTLVITIKYVTYVMRADNQGEGGMLALMALALRGMRTSGAGRRLAIVTWMGVFGAALFYGDGIITPAVSVLGAVEGLAVAQPTLKPFVIPASIGILVGLFLVQKRGTAGVGAIFGPLTLVWFAVLFLLGISNVWEEPQVFGAINPAYAVRFFLNNGLEGFLVLGAVVLVVTGGEALYADMGHFGARPIRIAWIAVVFPGLLMNYFGQGALLLRNPAAVENPFYLMAPGWALYPLIGLATMAACIASQAVISGTFSLTRQAIQLGYLPRMQIVHTSGSAIGQIYIPAINRFLMGAVIALVLSFQSSSNLAAAYGIAVTTDMVITSCLFFLVMHRVWKWNLGKALLLVGFFLSVELMFWAANITKFFEGGWFPLAIAGTAFLLMSTWKEGRALLSRRLRPGQLPVDLFLPSLASHPPAKVPGTAVFMTGDPEGTPHALLHNLKHNKVIHERTLFLTISTDDIPYVPTEERLEVARLDESFWRIVARFGYMETPNVPALLEQCRTHGLEFDMMTTTFFLGRETLIPTRRGDSMALWREQIFVTMSRNARPASDFFSIPPNRVVELGAQIEL